MYLVTLDKGYEEVPLDLCRDLYKANERKKEYEVGWSSKKPKISIRKINFVE